MVVGENGLMLTEWWRLDPTARARGTAADWAHEFAERFTDSVKIRLRADVEVGSCLSGGLDSSAVVTTATQLSQRPLHAFTCAYDEGPAYDERPHVRAVVTADANSRPGCSRASPGHGKPTVQFRTSPRRRSAVCPLPAPRAQSLVS